MQCVKCSMCIVQVCSQERRKGLARTYQSCFPHAYQGRYTISPYECPVWSFDMWGMGIVTMSVVLGENVLDMRNFHLSHEITKVRVVPYVPVRVFLCACARVRARLHVCMYAYTTSNVYLGTCVPACSFL